MKKPAGAERSNGLDLTLACLFDGPHSARPSNAFITERISPGDDGVQTRSPRLRGAADPPPRHDDPIPRRWLRAACRPRARARRLCRELARDRTLPRPRAARDRARAAGPRRLGAPARGTDARP